MKIRPAHTQPTQPPPPKTAKMPGRNCEKGVCAENLYGHKKNSARLVQSLENDFAQSYGLRRFGAVSVERIEHCQALLVKYFKNRQKIAKRFACKKIATAK